MTPTRDLVRPACVLLVLAAIYAPATARAQTADDLFSQNVVHEIRLFINSRDLSALRERYLENTYYPADLHWGGLRVQNVGVRSRGSGSRDANKLGLRIDFNRYVTGQRLVGLSSIVLDNMLQDPSMLRDRTAMAFFARMGQPASRISLARLYINNELEGVYGIVEEINKEYLTRTFGASDGHLFEYHWLKPYYFEDLGDDLTPYAAMFEPRTHENAALATLYSPLREMVRQTGNPGPWREYVDRYVDLKQLVAMTAIERFLAEFDGLSGYAGLNNFYLYRLPGSDRHVFLPWDRDNAFREDAGSVSQGLLDNHFLRQALEFPDLREYYYETLERCASMAETGNWLAGEFARSGALLAAHVPADVRKSYTNEDHTGAVAFLIEFSQRRPADVRAQIAAARAAAQTLR